MIVRSGFSDRHQPNDSLFAYLCQADLTGCAAPSVERHFNGLFQGAFSSLTRSG